MASPQKKAEFLYSFHWFRAIAIIFIVCGHAVPKLRSDEIPAQLLALFFFNGTVFFVFIAGYLFWHLKDKYSYGSYMVNKLKFVITPYLFIQTFAIIVALVGSNYGISFGQHNYDINIADPFKAYEGIVWHYWVGGSLISTFWFIPFIFLVFLSSPFIYSIAKGKYFFPTAIILIAISIFSSRGDLHNTGFFFPFIMFYHFIGIFFLGIMVKKLEPFFYREALLLAVSSFFIFLITYFVFVGTFIWGYQIGQIPDISLLKMVAASVFFASLLIIFERNKKGDDGKIVHKGFLINTMDILARYSFGIFFLHIFVLKFLEILFNHLFNGMNSVIGYLSLVIGTFLICIILISTIKYIFKSNSRLLIGS